MAPFTNMPTTVSTLARKNMESLHSGTFHPFTGPVYDQSVSLKIPAGKVPDDHPMLTTMNWYVKGIKDKLPE